MDLLRQSGQRFGRPPLSGLVELVQFAGKLSIGYGPIENTRPRIETQFMIGVLAQADLALLLGPIEVMIPWLSPASYPGAEASRCRSMLRQKALVRQ
jgi:hypothetical protein